MIGSKKSKETLSRMLESIHHRGPNNTGFYEDQEVCFGHKRLSIIDLSPAGNQPFISEDGRYVFIYNGEVYNFKTLRRELEGLGYQFKSNTDTEAIFYGYLHFGEAVVHKLRGMFVFSIYDTRQKKLVIFRDLQGIKPLYYTFQDETLVFASELKAVVLPSFIKRELAYSSAIEYLRHGHIASPSTPFANIYHLPPAHCLTFQNNSINLSYYGNPYRSETNNDISYDEAKSNVKRLVLDSVKEELISDVPIGVFLSGGLDSTVVATCAANSTTQKIQTFSVGFDGYDFELDESLLADSTSRHIGSDHHHINIGYSEFIESIPAYYKAIDHLSIDGLNTFLVSDYASQGVTVTLSGLGGDEVFGGYGWSKILNYEYQRTTYEFLKNVPFSTLVHLPQKYQERIILEKFKDHFPSFYAQMIRLFSFGDLKEIIGDKKRLIQFFKRSHYSYLDAKEVFSFEEEILRKTSIADQIYYMGNRLLVDSDIVSMCHSLEVRFPLIDNRIVNFVSSLPENFIWDEKFLSTYGKRENQVEFGRNRTKKLLYDAFRNELPPDFSKRSKTGFKLPMDIWLKKNIEEKGVLYDYFHGKNSLQINPKFSKKLLDQFMKGKIKWTKVWSLVHLNMFHAKYDLT